MIRLLLILFCISMGLISTSYSAELPESVRKQVPVGLQPVGNGTYKKMGFAIYDAVLWAPKGKWSQTQPYVLQIRYKRELSRDTMTSAVVDDLRAQRVTDDATMARWQEQLEEALPAVSKDDELLGLHLPGQDSRLYFNGRQIARIEDKALSDAFFGIWLGKHADAKLKSRLLAKNG